MMTGTQLEEMLDTLLEVGVFLLNRQKRTDLAEQLLSDGISVQDIKDLQHYLQGCCEDHGKAQRVMAAHLQDQPNRRNLFEDLRRRNQKVVPVVKKPQNDGGAVIRLQNMQKVREFDNQYNEWLQKKAAGQLPPVERRQMPWDL